MRTCYEIVDNLVRISSADPKSALESALAKNQYSITTAEFRLRMINLFEQAIEEIGFISHLPSAEVEQMAINVRAMQADCLMALCRGTVNEFNSVMKSKATISTLTLIGHTVSGIQAPAPAGIVREDLIADVQRWIEEINNSDLPPLEKAVILAKFRSLFRFLADSSGATDAQIRRRIKSVADDLSADLHVISDHSRPMIERIAAKLREPLKGTAAAVGLLADLTSLAPLLGIASIALLPPNPTPQLNHPSHYASDQDPATGP